MSVKTVYCEGRGLQMARSEGPGSLGRLSKYGVVLAELVEELAVECGELDRGGRGSSEVPQHLQVQCA